jgi:hypothetical protein
MPETMSVSPWLSSLARSLACLRNCLPGFLLAALLCGAPALAHTLYGHEDEFGVVHLHETRLDENYVLIYDSEERPRLGLEAIRTILRKNGGSAQDIRQEWIQEHVKKWIPRRLALSRPKPPTPAIRQAIQASSARHGLDPNLIYAVIEAESGFHQYAVSPKGAQGLMQIMPETQRTLGLRQPFDPRQNIDTGTRYLRALMKRFQSLELALAAYNAGPAVVERHKGVPPYAETRQYIQRVLARYHSLPLQDARQ